MDIGTGKDRPGEVVVWGYDLVNPDEEFSVAQYVTFARKVISDIHARGKLPILVGGTGLYIKGVVDGIDTVGIPPDEKLRKRLVGMGVYELQKKLLEIDGRKFKTMSLSDRANPRRLVRAIEIAKYNKANKPVNQSPNNYYDVLFVGLKLSEDELRERIIGRVAERIKQGFEKEVEFLKEKGFFIYAPSRTLGYKDWPDIEKWKREEFRYAKRQITWFKKEKRIKWFGASEENFVEKIEKLVKKWHNR